MNTSTACSRDSAEFKIEQVASNCDMHGAFVAGVVRFSTDRATRPVCPKCEETRRGEEDARRERERREQCLAAALKHAQIPPRFADKTLQNYVAGGEGQRRALDVASRFVEGFEGGTGSSLVMLGNPGTGKTHLACAIGAAIVRRGYPFRYCTALQAIRRIKATYNRGSEQTETAAIADLTAPDLLVLDEVGVQLGTQHELTLLFDVLNDRYANLKSTILCANLTEAELNQLLGERIIDRFRECGITLTFTWKSERGCHRPIAQGSRGDVEQADGRSRSDQ